MPTLRRDSIIGQLVADRFRVLSLLGEGGTGQVYLAQHDVLERKFAIKVLRRDMITDPTAVERFRREARAASRMQHRNIVYISDFGQLPDDRLYLVMEYIPGEELRAVLGRERRFDLDRALRILIQIANALAYAHEQGVVHRDLKSENIILTTDRHRTDLVKILDFGLAKILFGAGNLDTITFKGQVFGTPEYISPEQIVGDEVDQRTDIYAFGVLAFELITGRTPFTGTLMELLVAHRKMTPPVPSAVCPSAEIPSWYDAMVERALRKNAGERFQRADELAHLLHGFLSERSSGGMLPLDSDLDLLTPPVIDPSASSNMLPQAPSTPPATDPMSDGEEMETIKESADPGPEITQDAPPERLSKSQRRETRRQYRRLLRHLAKMLHEQELATPELETALDEHFQLDDRVIKVEQEVAGLDAQLESAEAVGRERESQLRYAIIDLGMERGRLQNKPQLSAADQAMVADLGYQVTELEHRLLDFSRNREAQLDEIDAQLSTNRRQLDDLRANLVRQDRQLQRLLDAHLQDIRGTDDMAQVYTQLDELRQRLGR
jgi:serine/threonine protein kinase